MFDADFLGGLVRLAVKWLWIRSKGESIRKLLSWIQERCSAKLGDVVNFPKLCAVVSLWRGSLLSKFSRLLAF